MSNQNSVEDEITREAAQFGRAALAVVQAYQQRHPGRRLPRSVQRDAHRAFRGEMKAQQARVKVERGQVQLDITEQIKMHANASISTRRNPASTPEKWAEQQWQLDQRRMQLEMAIQTAPHLSREERGQAVTALVASHYADNPKVKQPPVFGGKLAGIKALRARLADRLSQAKLSIAEQLDPGRGKGQQSGRRMPAPAQPVRRMPATTVKLPVHPYWQRSNTDLDAQAHRIEQQQRRLAEQAQRELRIIAERDQLRVERDQLQNQVNSMGDQLGEAARQNRGLAEDLAQRGQELTTVHQQVDRVIGQRDEAVRKVASMTAPADRLGSPERQAAAARSKTPAAPTTPSEAQQAPVTVADLDKLDGMLRRLGVPEDLRTRVTGDEVREKIRRRDEAPTMEAPKVEAPAASGSTRIDGRTVIADNIGGTGNTGYVGPRNGAPSVDRGAPPERPNGTGDVHISRDSRVIAGNVGGNGNNVHVTPDAPEATGTPQAPEPPSGPEAPDAAKGAPAPKGSTTPKRTGSRSRKSPAAPAAPEQAQELVGAVASAAAGGRSGGSTRRVNGSRKVIGGTPAAPAIPLPPEPPTGFEPPEMDR